MKQWADPTRDRKRLRRPQLQRAQRTNTAEVLKAVVLRFVGPVRPCAISSKKRVMMRSAWTEPSDGEPASPRSKIIFARLSSHKREQCPLCVIGRRLDAFARCPYAACCSISFLVPSSGPAENHWRVE